MTGCPAPLALAALLAMLAAAAAPSAARAEAPAQAPAHVTGTAVIEDGDTLDLGPVPIRLHGIDAPEAGQRCATPSGGQWACGAVATARLDELAGGRALRCLARDVDRYGRVVATCAVEDEAEGGDGPSGVDDLSAVLAREGLAWAFLEYSDDYVDQEAGARAVGIGIWQAPTQTAEAYRADRWNRAAAASPRAGCPIKGNIGRDGRRIYHTPWSPYYARTRIDPDAGERWFCDEGEAQGAGWTAAQAR